MFWHRGPNGNHLCLVLELAGPKIESYIKYRSTGSLTVTEMQKVALNVANALGYMHAERYVHGGEHS
jgi:serine/threonine-protein kinase SRPK3